MIQTLGKEVHGASLGAERKENKHGSVIGRGILSVFVRGRPPNPTFRESNFSSGRKEDAIVITIRR